MVCCAVDPGADEALQLFKTVAIGGTPDAPTGTIDIASGGFVASKAAGNSLATLLAWQNASMVQNTGKGLTSSWILSHPDYGLAVVDNANLGLIRFHGRDVTADSLIVAPALLGDSNLDSTVNFADLVTLAENFGASNSTWAIGDFNGDRMVNFGDLSLIEQNYGQSEENFAAAWALARSLVPLNGDYNADGAVDAADYTVWREQVGEHRGKSAKRPKQRLSDWRCAILHLASKLRGNALPEAAELALAKCLSQPHRHS